MNGWIPSERNAEADRSTYGFKEAEFFGVDRSVPPARFWSLPARRRGWLERARDAWDGLLFGWRHGRIDE